MATKPYPQIEETPGVANEPAVAYQAGNRVADVYQVSDTERESIMRAKEQFADDGYANIKICEAASGWKALRRIDASYVEGFKLLGTECDYDESGIGFAYQDANGAGVVPYAIQAAGDVVTNDPDNHVMKFRLTADCVNYLIDTATKNDSSYNGIQLQGYNVIVKSITVSQPGVTMCSNGENAGILVS